MEACVTGHISLTMTLGNKDVIDISDDECKDADRVPLLDNDGNSLEKVRHSENRLRVLSLVFRVEGCRKTINYYDG